MFPASPTSTQTSFISSLVCKVIRQCDINENIFSLDKFQIVTSHLDITIIYFCSLFHKKFVIRLPPHFHLIYYPARQLTMTSTKASTYSTPHPIVDDALISFPTPHILLITLNRPRSLNCLNTTANHQLHALYTWYDAEPTLRCAILTGTGRAFCAGADLKEWDTQNSPSPESTASTSYKQSRMMPKSGFGGLSRRSGKKPVIAAVNGICFGGGCEMIVNADMVFAAPKATFALPEGKRGVVAVAGALPRIVRTIGRPRAMEMVLTGRTVGADEAASWGLINRVVGEGEGEVVREAIRVAESIVAASPDSVIVSREGVKAGWEGGGVEEGTERVESEWFAKMDRGENMKEGLRAFVEKRQPRWVASKL